jgi:hypothetical protein
MYFTKKLTELEFALLRALWGARGMTRRDLERTLGLSRPTVEKALRSLQTAGFIDSHAESVAHRGRPAQVFVPKDDAWYSLGMDFELPDVNLVLTDAWGHPLHEKHLRMDDGLADPRAVLDLLALSIRTWLEGIAAAPERLSTIGIGVPGFLADGGVSFIGRELPAWRRVQVGEYMERAFAVPVLVGHDVHFMAMAEASHRDWKDGVVLFLALRPGMGGGIRIGGCLCLDGAPYRGGRGNGGALYQAVVEPEEFTKLTAEDRVKLVADRLVTSLVHIIPMADPDWTVLHAEALEEAESQLVSRCQERLRDAFADQYIGVPEIMPAVVRGASGAQQAAVAAIGERLLRNR